MYCFRSDFTTLLHHLDVNMSVGEIEDQVMNLGSCNCDFMCIRSVGVAS